MKEREEEGGRREEERGRREGGRRKKEGRKGEEEKKGEGEEKNQNSLVPQNLMKMDPEEIQNDVTLLKHMGLLSKEGKKTIVNKYPFVKQFVPRALPAVLDFLAQMLPVFLEFKDTLKEEEREDGRGEGKGGGGGGGETVVGRAVMCAGMALCALTAFFFG
jgi:hypothetical protein